MGGGLSLGAVPAAGNVGRQCATFAFFFLTSAALHAAEVAITTLYPWKVKEFVEDEGRTSAFAMLEKDVTRVLTTILVATTCASICSTAIFASLASRYCSGSARRLAYATTLLTALTLFLGELLPKALGVNNAEKVARFMIVPINALTVVLGPVGTQFAAASKRVLRLLGFKSVDAGAVTQEELRLIITGASISGGIESMEGTMIEGVLDLQQTRVAEVMQPRVDVRALERRETMLSLLHLVEATGHTRIPVYDDEIDNIIGVVNAKKLLELVKDPASLNASRVESCCEPTYFVPETMVAWKVLEEMRRRRLHMAIVVDEYGGTAGVVTLEDILEVVVGEIYDEDDEKLSMNMKDDDIVLEDDASYTIRGTAALDDVVELLCLEGVDVDALPDVTTAAGFVCYHAGEIPAAGDHILIANYDFEITKADERRVYDIKARSLDFDGVLAMPERPVEMMGRGRPGFGRRRRPSKERAADELEIVG
ncbi:hypothetical protein M885DRAFT_447003 [Pelagophyceae sp. CCMP2097]|nr:hypothetical protein M885DRAFT_447003 [Pelagophyceae sp. CCMP2097]